MDNYNKVREALEELHMTGADFLDIITRVHVEDEMLYVLTFYFMNNYRYSKVFNADTLNHCFMSDTVGYGARIVEEVKRQFLIERGLTYI